jgi:DNA-binding NtrC family response regulator
LRGEAVLARMRELKPDVKVIVSSGDGSAGVAQFPGASAVLSKPYTPTRLCEVIRQVLDH